ncbi:hypothetical protein ACFV1F_15585 [Streptomyces sp. NPDC059590]|uniref:hypothetical protein n=1 Tax=Streptomyces sp. NPDC059590 TaxID=3346877 RepID=UPI00368BBB0D
MSDSSSGKRESANSARCSSTPGAHWGHWHGGHTDVSSGARGSVDLTTRIGP